MTTPEPVSPAPDTEALRGLIEDRLAWSPYEDVQRHRAEVLDAACSLIAEREAGLRADLDRARVERDARQQVLDEIREHLDLPDTADLAMVESTARVAIQTSHDLTAENERLRAEVERLETLVLEKHELIQGWARYGERVKADRARFGDMLIAALGLQHEPVSRHFHRLVPAAVQELARLRVELARVSGDRPTPDDEAVAHLAEELRECVEESEGVASLGNLRIIALNAMAVLRDIGWATPSTGPAPAAADAQSVGWRSGWAAACRALDQFAAERMDAADDRDDKPVADAYGAVTVRAQLWMYNPERAPAAPQAPAQPTAKLATAKHPRNHSLDTHALHDCGGDPKCCGDPDDEAASEGTAPPAPVVHEVTILADQHPDYFVARCTPCGFIAGDFDEQWVQDRADAHRADTLRPSGPVAPVTPANPTP